MSRKEVLELCNAVRNGDLVKVQEVANSKIINKTRSVILFYFLTNICKNRMAMYAKIAFILFFAYNAIYILYAFVFLGSITLRLSL